MAKKLFLRLKFQVILGNSKNRSGGVLASWFVRSSPDRAVRVRALAGDIVLCS